MKTLLAAVTLVAALAHPAAAVTFPSLTTIYVGAGVMTMPRPQRCSIAPM